MDQTEKKTVLEGGSEATRTGVDNHEWALQSLTRERDALRWLLALTEKTVMLLRQDALYVQGACHDDLEKVMSSGFLPASTNRTSSPLSRPSLIMLG